MGTVHDTLIYSGLTFVYFVLIPSLHGNFYSRLLNSFSLRDSFFIILVVTYTGADMRSLKSE